MTTHTTKTWFEDGRIIEQVIPEAEIYKQEPVAWHYPGGSPEQCTTDKAYAQMEPAWTPMYHKREWVGLTEGEVDEIIDDVIGFNSCWGPEEDFAQAIEAKLKEKNT